MRRKDLEQLLDEELEVLRAGLDFEAARVHVERKGSVIFVAFERGPDGRSGLFKLDCKGFDAQPPSVTMVSPFTGDALPIGSWTPGVAHSVHPVVDRPFVCLQGIAEYHNHPSHLGDSWDRYRHRFRIPETIKGLLKKAGVLT